MSDPKQCFEGARSKINRANHHIKELVSVVNAFLETDVCKILIEEEPETGKNTLCIDARTSFPPDVPLLIGDAVHNLRTALDHIVVHLIGSNDSWMAMPTGATRHNVESTPHYRTIKKALPELAALILDEIQPYRGGKFRVWELGKLDNVDKHQLLIPTIKVSGLAGVAFKDDRGLTLSGPGILAGDHGSISRVIGGLGKVEIQNKGKPVVDISFGPGTFVEGEPVLETLSQFSQLALEAVEAFERFCFRNVPDPH